MTGKYTKLYPFQREGATQLELFGGNALLADEMGLGKTLQTLTWIRRNPEARPVVVVCPASLKWVWEREAAKHVHMIAVVLEGTKPPHNPNYLKGHQLIVINYDILKPWIGHLKAINPQVVVLDEIHYVSSRNALRSKMCAALINLGERVPHVIGISGTPLTNRPAELWHPLKLIRPTLFPSFWAFAHRFCQPKHTPWGWQFNGANDLPKLHRILKRKVMIRRTVKEVLHDLPPSSQTIIPLDISNRREYEEANYDLIGWLAKQNLAKAAKAVRAQALLRMGYLLRLTAKLKLKSAIDWINNYLEESGGKLLVFGVHKSDPYPILPEIHERFRKHSVLLTGDTDRGKDGRGRQRLFDKFNHDPATRMLVGNLQVCGTGVSVTSTSSAAFVEFGWRPGDIAQAKKRIEGIGRGVAGEPAKFFFLVARNTVEEKLIRLLERKQRVLDEVLDGDPHSTDFDLVSQLAKIMLREGTR